MLSTVTLGGMSYDIPDVLPFAALKRCKPAMAAWLDFPSQAQQTLGIVDQVSISIRVISAALVDKNPDLSPEKIEAVITRDEWGPLIDAVRAVMLASGVIRVKAPGGATPGEAAPPEPPAAA